MKEITFVKEINTRLPKIDVALSEFFKRKDGTSPIKVLKEDKRNTISLFIIKNSGKKKTREYVDPETKEISFKNDNNTLNISLDKKKFILSWDGGINCDTSDPKVSCSINGFNYSPFSVPVPDANKKTPLRLRPKVQKVLKRKQQTREVLEFDSIDLWTEAKTNVRDINQLALVGGSAFLGASVFTPWFIPAIGLLTVASPMMVGATALANGEAIVRNYKGEWYINGDMRDDKWISKIQINPKDLDKVTVLQDDGFYFHAKIDMNKKVKCNIIEESDVLSFYPERRLECHG